MAVVVATALLGLQILQLSQRTLNRAIDEDFAGRRLCHLIVQDQTTHVTPHPGPEESNARLAIFWLPPA